MIYTQQMQFTIHYLIRRFETRKSFPKKYKNESSSVEPPAKCGKPVNVDRATAFNHVVEYLQEKDEEEQLTINDLAMLMDEQLKNNPHKAVSSEWMKDHLMEQLRNDIVISEINENIGGHFEEESITTFFANFTTSRNQVALKSRNGVLLLQQLNKLSQR